MPLRTSRREKPVDELSDRELRKRIHGVETTVANLPPPETSAEERDKALALARAATAQLPALRAEMKARERLARHRETEKAALRGGYERAREVLPPGAIEGVQRLGQDVGLKLDVKKLGADERGMVLKLWSSVHAGDASPEERTEFEALVEKAADRPGVFAERRAEAAAKRQRNELLEEAHTAMLPRRRRYEEPGAVVLPRWVFAALQSSQKGQWTVADVGTVAVFMSMFEERRSLIIDTHFEDAEEGEPVLVGRGSLTRIRFEPGVNPQLEAPTGAGHVDLPRAVERLAANGWFDVRELRGGIEIRLGERARKLLER
ncbi:MAG: hypothetical protein H0T97_00680 [Actinobacteria bacterium]|nr:hypothetical protein [Actinomycetota bacterium]